MSDISRISLFLRKHWIGLAAAVLVGGIIVAPNVVFMHSSEYRGVPMFYTDYENYYVTQLNASYVGCIINCDPYVNEPVYQPFFNASIAEPILAVPGIILHIPATQLIVIYDFLLPFILALLVYALAYRLIRNSAGAAFATILILLGYTLFNATDTINLSALIELSRLQTFESAFLIYSRPINPQFSSIIFFLYLNALLSYFRAPAASKAKTAYLYIVTFLSALSFYIYFYLCTFIVATNIVILLFNVFSRKIKNAVMCSIGFLASIIGGSVAIYNWYSLLHDNYFSLLPNEQLVATHMPSISLLGISLFILFCCTYAIFFTSKKITVDAEYIFMLCVASFIVMNQQIISGKIFQPFHYEYYYLTPILVLAIFLVAREYFLHSTHQLIQRTHTIFVAKIFLVVASILVIGNAIFIQWHSYTNWYSYTGKLQKYVPTLTWIQKNIPQGSTIETDGTLSFLIPLYTHDYVPSSPDADQYLVAPICYETKRIYRIPSDLDLPAYNSSVIRKPVP